MFFPFFVLNLSSTASPKCIFLEPHFVLPVILLNAFTSPLCKMWTANSAVGYKFHCRLFYVEKAQMLPPVCFPLLLTWPLVPFYHFWYALSICFPIFCKQFVHYQKRKKEFCPVCFPLFLTWPLVFFCHFWYVYLYASVFLLVNSSIIRKERKNFELNIIVVTLLWKMLMQMHTEYIKYGKSIYFIYCRKGGISSWITAMTLL